MFCLLTSTLATSAKAEGTSSSTIQAVMVEPTQAESDKSLDAATVTGPEHVATEHMTVLELMRLEAEQALHEARERRGSRHRGPGLRSLNASMMEGGRGPQTAGLHLVGIYGVGKRLVAEVKNGARTLYFRNGQEKPMGHVADEDLYRLRELKGNCVRLDRGGTEELLCLPTRGRP